MNNESLIMKFKEVGNDVRVSNMVDISRPQLIKIGNHVGIDSFFACTTQLEIGNYVHISPRVSVIGGAEGLFRMADFTFLSTGSNIICGSEEFKGAGLIGPLIPSRYHDTIIRKPVIIERYAGVCAGSTVLPGAVISEGSVIGANSLVLANTVTEPWTIYVGSPIRPVAKRPNEIMIDYAEKFLAERGEHFLY